MGDLPFDEGGRAGIRDGTVARAGDERQESAIQELIVGKLLAAGLPKSSIVRDDTHKKSIIGGEVGNLIVSFRSR